MNRARTLRLPLLWSTLVGMTWTFLRSMSYVVIVLSTPTKKIKFHSGWTVIAIVRIKIHVTKFNFSLSKHLQCADSMLQCPFISSIVFKDPDWKLGHIVTTNTTNSTYTQVTLSMMDGGQSTTRPRNFPPCLSLHIHNKYQRVPHNVQTTIKKHTCWS